MNLALLSCSLLAAWAALVVDRRWGEPPVQWHPVVFMGRYLSATGPRLWRLPPREAYRQGALAWCLGAFAVFGVATLLQMGLWWLAGWGGLGLVVAGLALGLLLKPLLAWRMLYDEVWAVELALRESLADGQACLARLVSRNVENLDAAGVREAAIETLAENLNDSVVAPLLAWGLLGLPGAALYRFANTADAMWGYRDHREWGGKWAARADDLLSWAPARLTAWGLCAVGRADPNLWPAPKWAKLQREAGRTPSPNGGWPMAAMAFRLGCRLGKPGVYVLNGRARAPGPADVQRALQLADGLVRRLQQGLMGGVLLLWLLIGLWQVLGPRL